jgi:hypothetical protein
VIQGFVQLFHGRNPLSSQTRMGRFFSSFTFTRRGTYENLSCSHNSLGAVSVFNGRRNVKVVRTENFSIFTKRPGLFGRISWCQTTYKRRSQMTKFLTMMSVAIFVGLFGSSAFAESGMSKQEQQSQSMGDQKSKGTTQDTTPNERESEDQKAARPGEVGKEGDDFANPSTLPPGGEHSPGYTGADKEAEQQDRALQKERERKGKSSH